MRSFEQQLNLASREQAIEFAVDLYRQMLQKDNSYRQLIEKQWGLDKPLGNP